MGRAPFAGCAVLLLTVPAQAQLGVVTFEGDMARCAEDAVGDSCGVDGDCESRGIREGECVDAAEGTVCIGDNILHCCDDNGDCVSPEGEEGTCAPLGEGFGICRYGSVYCEGAAGASLDRTRQCHRRPGSGPLSFTFRWESGDCDEDGIANEDEVDGWICLPNPQIYHDDECIPLEPCTRDRDECELPDGSPGDCVAFGTANRFCIPSLEFFSGPAPRSAYLFCCDDSIPCPGGEIETCSGSGFCGAGPCPSNVACLRDSEGQRVAPYFGDCDEDGCANYLEWDGESNIACDGSRISDACDEDAGVRPDAGTAVRDAGADSGGTGRDASTSMDAGSLDAGSLDAGAGSQSPIYSGGARCSVNPRGRQAPWGVPWGVLWLVLAWFGTVRRRRRRSGS